MSGVGAAYSQVTRRLREHPRRWLVTGAAGFIGSHLVSELLRLDQGVVGLDDFSTGTRENVAEVLAALPPDQAERFRMIEGDLCDSEHCARACDGVELVLHQAALGSVPRSIHDPLRSHEVNVTGFLRLLLAARGAGIRRLVYASSSSVYGDLEALPKVEEVLGRPLSPYAVTKCADELYAHAFGRCFGLELIGLRYFNVFGPRQRPDGPYAAVIPRWFSDLLNGRRVVINGDGETSRDFCFVDNVVQANLLAATTGCEEALGQAFNVAVGERTTLNELFRLIRAEVARSRPLVAQADAIHGELRAGDVRHSLADVGKARRLLGYEPGAAVREGLGRSAPWYVAALGRNPGSSGRGG